MKLFYKNLLLQSSNYIHEEIKNLHKVYYFSYDKFSDYNLFYNKMSSYLWENKLYAVLIRINFEKDSITSEWKMLGDQIRINTNNLDSMENVVSKLYSNILDRINITLEKYRYEEGNIEGLQVLIFEINPSKDKLIKFEEKSLSEHKDLINVTKTSNLFNRVIPLSYNINLFGTLLRTEVVNGVKFVYLSNDTRLDILEFINKHSKNNITDVDSSIKFFEKVINNISYIFIIEPKDTSNTIHIYDSNGIKIETVIDTKVDNEMFTRRLGNVVFYINLKGVFKKEIDIEFAPVYPKPLKSKYTKLIQPDYRIGSLDLETYKDIEQDVNLTYAIGFYTKDNIKTFYINEELDSWELIIRCLKSLLTDKYTGYSFYVHNLGGYDVYFILKAILLFNENTSNEINYDIIFRDEKIICLNLSYKPSTKVYSIRIVDSYLLLNSSLDKLSKTFKTETKKSFFPYEFINKNNLFWSGNKPDIKYFINEFKNDNIDESTYNNIPSTWSTRNETLRYLENDLISLFLVIEAFKDSIYIKYHTHITNSLTISGLCMDIFLRRYYKKDIPLIKQKSIYNNIKKSYFGGITEVYKPFGKNLYYYDVNSLYPFSALNPMPGLSCVFKDNINSDISDIYTSMFGFYYCKIEAPDSYLGLLPYRSSKGLIMPLGQFEGWYFSEELKFAYDNGYKINVSYGYEFDRTKDTFKGYIEDIYKIKATTKDTTSRSIAKSMLNNLIGKFGLDINKYNTEVLDLKEFLDILSSRKVRSFKFISSNKVLVSYDKEISKTICSDYDIDYSKIFSELINKSTNKKGIFKDEDYNDVSIAVASAVTAYSRIYINKAKLNVINKGGSIYYTDTDSLITDVELDTNLVGNNIGQFKLEYEILEGYFISNKTYAIITNSGETIIKSKGVLDKSLDYDSFKRLYSGELVKAIRLHSNKDLSKGSVTLYNKQSVQLSPNSYTKRTKVYDNRKWVNTIPVVLHSNYHTKSFLDKTIKISYRDILVSIIIIVISLVTFYLILPNYNLTYIPSNVDECSTIESKVINLLIDKETIYPIESSNKTQKNSWMRNIYNHFFRGGENVNLLKEYKISNIEFKPKIYNNVNIKDAYISLLHSKINYIEKETHTLIDSIILDLDIIKNQYPDNKELGLNISKLKTMSSVNNTPVLNDIEWFKSNNNSINNTPVKPKLIRKNSFGLY